MPDRRSHRGAHPEDAALFAPVHWPALRQATQEVCWLLDRDYALRSSLALVGDRHGLTQRQRLAVARCACSAVQLAARRAREQPAASVDGQALWIDGYNLLITVEAALSGGIILHGRDGCHRDMASLHGSYRRVAETEPALQLIGEALAALHPSACHWILDRPVANSGRLKAMIETLAGRAGWPWTVRLEPSADRVLADVDGIVASSDSVVLDRCRRWFNASRHLVAQRLPAAHVLSLAAEALA